MPRGAEYFCLLMVYLKRPGRKINRSTRLVWSLGPDGFSGGREEPTHNSMAMVWRSFGHGSSGRRACGLLSHSIMHSLDGEGRLE